jgi:hypothetical protein
LVSGTCPDGTEALRKYGLAYIFPRVKFELLDRKLEDMMEIGGHWCEHGGSATGAGSNFILFDYVCHKCDIPLLIGREHGALCSKV